MEVRWLEQSLADVRAPLDWLSAAEVARLNVMRVPKRRDDWRLGRWTAKQAVAAYLDLPSDAWALAGIEIRPADSGAPEVFLHDGPAAVSISLTHRDGIAACALAPAGIAVGCDLELVEPRGEAFIADYFTAREQELIARTPQPERFRVVALLWSAKESTLKVLRTGLRLDTRDVEVTLADELPKSSPENLWRPLRSLAYEQEYSGWWQIGGDLIRTLMSSTCSAPPQPLQRH